MEEKIQPGNLRKKTAIFLHKPQKSIESFVSYENHLQTYLLIKVWETQFM